MVSARDPGRFISRNLKLGGIDKRLGGVNMREKQIYIKSINKQKKWHW